jgi:hypothetical protein
LGNYFARSQDWKIPISSNTGKWITTLKKSPFAFIVNPVRLKNGLCSPLLYEGSGGNCRAKKCLSGLVLTREPIPVLLIADDSRLLEQWIETILQVVSILIG